MNYINLLTLEYPRHEGDIRLEHPEITDEETHPNFPCPDTYAKVEWVDPPSFNKDTQIAYEDAPIQVDGVWKMQWLVKDYTTQELSEIEAMKAEANALRFSPRPNTDKPGELPNAI